MKVFTAAVCFAGLASGQAWYTVDSDETRGWSKCLHVDQWKNNTVKDDECVGLTATCYYDLLRNGYVNTDDVVPPECKIARQWAGEPAEYHKVWVPIKYIGDPGAKAELDEKLDTFGRTIELSNVVRHLDEVIDRGGLEQDPAPDVPALVKELVAATPDNNKMKYDNSLADLAMRVVKPVLRKNIEWSVGYSRQGSREATLDKLSGTCFHLVDAASLSRVAHPKPSNTSAMTELERAIKAVAVLKTRDAIIRGLSAPPLPDFEPNIEDAMRRLQQAHKASAQQCQARIAREEATAAKSAELAFGKDEGARIVSELRKPEQGCGKALTQGLRAPAELRKTSINSGPLRLRYIPLGRGGAQILISIPTERSTTTNSLILRLSAGDWASRSSRPLRTLHIGSVTTEKKGQQLGPLWRAAQRGQDSPKCSLPRPQCQLDINSLTRHSYLVLSSAVTYALSLSTPCTKTRLCNP